MEGNIVIWVIDDSWKKITASVKIEIFLMGQMKWKRLLSSIDIMVQIEGINCIFGKKKTKVQKKKRKRKEDVDQEPKGWKKRSIFFELRYWENHMLQHNLDVMHIEKKCYR